MLKPGNVLDIGCGCGSFTVELSSFCRHITAIDVSESLIKRCCKENSRPNIDYRCLDGTKLDFSDNYFDWAFCRMSLHHDRNWRKIVDEMLRVARYGILVEEPFDDPRSAAKRNTMQEQRLFLELQAEVGYPHYPHVTPEQLTGFLQDKRVRFEWEIIRSDEPVSFGEFSESWGFFADKSTRKEYWLQRLSDYRRELGDGQLCESDILFVIAHK